MSEQTGDHSTFTVADILEFHKAGDGYEFAYETDYRALAAQLTDLRRHLGTLTPGGSHTCITCAAHCVALEDAAARIAQVEAELADWQRMRNEAMAVAAKNGDRIHELEAMVLVLRDEVAKGWDRNRALEEALRRIAAYSPRLTPMPGDPIEIARTALETTVCICNNPDRSFQATEGCPVHSQANRTTETKGEPNV